MKQVPFKELELGSKKIVSVGSIANEQSEYASCINRVIIITETIDGYINYYWIDAEVTHYGIGCPMLYELTEEEAEKYL